MLKLTSKIIKRGQSFLDELDDVDWGDDTQQRAVTDENLDQFLTDDIEETPEYEELGEPRYDYQEEIPLARPGLGIPEGTREIDYADPAQMLSDAMDNAELVSFEYTNRHGNYAGLRTVEPHYTFIAQTTGNEVLVTFDIGQSDIRAFIVGNIHPNGVRYEGIEFDPRDEIMRGVV